MITVDQYLNQWRRHYDGRVTVPEDELTDQMRADAEVVVDRAKTLLAEFGDSDRGITSGWRPTAVNKIVPGAAMRSKHTMCRAIDIADPEGDLDHWCMENQEALERIGLWQEHPGSTKGWCHVQTVPYGSWVEGKPRWFYP